MHLYYELNLSIRVQVCFIIKEIENIKNKIRKKKHIKWNCHNFFTSSHFTYGNTKGKTNDPSSWGQQVKQMSDLRIHIAEPNICTRRGRNTSVNKCRHHTGSLSSEWAQKFMNMNEEEFTTVACYDTTKRFTISEQTKAGAAYACVVFILDAVNVPLN